MLKSVLVQLAPLSNQVVENWRLVDEHLSAPLG